MTSVDEAVSIPPQFQAGALELGIGDISQQAEYVFGLYRRQILPLDGFVFWVRNSEIRVHGIFRHAADRGQAEDETASTNAVLFSTTTKIVDLNVVNQDVLVVGETEGVRYAFNRHGLYNLQANVWHYSGTSLLAAFGTQLIDDPAQFNGSDLIVSDSLPAWLQIASYTPPWLVPLNPKVPLFPSFLVPSNYAPPYASVHHEPGSIQALQSVPWRQALPTPTLQQPATMTLHRQLVSEKVRVTLYGCDNATALAFLDTVIQYSVDTDLIGITNMPTVRDGKRTWPEGMLLAQQKLIDFDLTWDQSALYQVAQELIAAASTTVTPIVP